MVTLDRLVTIVGTVAVLVGRAEVELLVDNAHGVPTAGIDIVGVVTPAVHPRRVVWQRVVEVVVAALLRLVGEVLLGIGKGYFGYTAKAVIDRNAVIKDLT